MLNEKKKMKKKRRKENRWEEVTGALKNNYDRNQFAKFSYLGILFSKNKNEETKKNITINALWNNNT